MSRRLRRDLHKRVSSAGYQKFNGDIEVTGNIIGPSMANVVTAIDKIVAGTTTPVQLTITRCEGGYKSIILQWLVQYNLMNFDHYEIQVSDDGSTWYSLEFDGSDWKDTLDADTDVVAPILVHVPIPFGGTEAAPTAVTLYYRMRHVTILGVASAWSATASDTTSLVQTGDIVANAVTSGKIIANAITTSKVNALAITAEKIAASAITVGKIASNAVQTQNLSVIARELINNISQTEVLNGWGGINEDGSGSTSIMSLVDVTVNGAVTKVLRIFNSGNRSIRSKTFPVNHDKIYRYTIWLRKNSTEGLIYLGLSAFDEVNEGYEGSSNGSGDKLIKLYNASTRAYSSESANMYFHLGFDQTVWTEYTTYIVGANRDVNDCPQHKLCTYIAKLGSDTTDVAIRILNWSNISSRTLDLCSPSITEVGAGQIVAENIVANAITAGKILAGAVETDKLAVNAVVAVKIAANAVTAVKIIANAITTNKILAGAVTADKITAATLQTLLLKAAYVWVGFAGSGTYDSPDEGDRRIYVDDDEILFQIYTDGAWSAERQIAFGGVDANSNFRPFIACRGVLGDITDSPLLDPIPSRSHHLFKFDNNAEDQHGVDPWTVTLGAFVYDAGTKWEGTHSLAPSAVLLNAWYAGGWEIGNSVTACFMIRINDDVLIGHDIFEWGVATDPDYINIEMSGSAKRVLKVTVKKGGTSTTITASAFTRSVWHFVEFTYDKDANKAYLRIDDVKYSSTPSGTWGSGTNSFFLTLIGGASYDRFIDDLLLSHDTAMDPDLFFQHVTRNVAWTADYFAADLLLKPKLGGAVVLDILSYETGWINRNDWSNVHPGSNTSKNVDSNITHNLNAPLSKLLVKFFISTDGTNANSFEINVVTIRHATATDNWGIVVDEVDNNNILIQTGQHGIMTLNTSGGALAIDNENWYYNAKMWYLG